MEFTPESLVGQSVRCMTSSLDRYDGKLQGFDSSFNTTLANGVFTPNGYLHASKGTTTSAPPATSPTSATTLFVRGSRLMYIGFE